MSPCFTPIFSEISFEFASNKIVMGGKNLLSVLFGKYSIMQEITFGMAVFTIPGLPFDGISSDHRTDEDIVNVLRESV